MRASNAKASGASAVWVGGLVRANFYLADGSKPTLALWITRSGLVVNMALVPHEQGPATLSALLAEALTLARARGQRPDALEVTAAELFTNVASVECPPPASLHTGSFFAMVAYDQLAYQVEPARGLFVHETYLQAGLERSTVREMARSAIDFGRTVPLVEGDPRAFKVSIPSLGLANACVWAGSEVLLTHGMLIFRSAVAYVDAMRAWVQYTHTFPEGYDQSFAELLIQTKRGAPKLSRELKRMGFRGRDLGLVPIPAARDPQGVRRPLRPIDLLRITAVSQAIAEGYEELSTTGRHTSPCALRLAVSLGKTLHAAHVTYPHPELGATDLELGKCAQLNELDAVNAATDRISKTA